MNAENADFILLEISAVSALRGLRPKVFSPNKTNNHPCGSVNYRDFTWG